MRAGTLPGCYVLDLVVSVLTARKILTCRPIINIRGPRHRIHDLAPLIHLHLLLLVQHLRRTRANQPERTQPHGALCESTAAVSLGLVVILLIANEALARHPLPPLRYHRCQLLLFQAVKVLVCVAYDGLDLHELLGDYTIVFVDIH